MAAQMQSYPVVWMPQAFWSLITYITFWDFVANLDGLI